MASARSCQARQRRAPLQTEIDAPPREDRGAAAEEEARRRAQRARRAAAPRAQHQLGRRPARLRTPRSSRDRGGLPPRLPFERRRLCRPIDDSRPAATWRVGSCHEPRSRAWRGDVRAAGGGVHARCSPSSTVAAARDSARGRPQAAAVARNLWRSRGACGTRAPSNYHLDVGRARRALKPDTARASRPHTRPPSPSARPTVGAARAAAATRRQKPRAPRAEGDRARPRRDERARGAARLGSTPRARAVAPPPRADARAAARRAATRLHARTPVRTHIRATVNLAAGARAEARASEADGPRASSAPRLATRAGLVARPRPARRDGRARARAIRRRRGRVAPAAAAATATSCSTTSEMALGIVAVASPCAPPARVTRVSIGVHARAVRSGCDAGSDRPGAACSARSATAPGACSASARAAAPRRGARAGELHDEGHGQQIMDALPPSRRTRGSCRNGCKDSTAKLLMSAATMAATLTLTIFHALARARLARPAAAARRARRARRARAGVADAAGRAAHARVPRAVPRAPVVPRALGDGRARGRDLAPAVARVRRRRRDPLLRHPRRRCRALGVEFRIDDADAPVVEPRCGRARRSTAAPACEPATPTLGASARRSRAAARAVGARAAVVGRRRAARRSRRTRSRGARAPARLPRKAARDGARRPRTLRALLARLADGLARYAAWQVARGAQIVMVFESCAGVLSGSSTTSSRSRTSARSSTRCAAATRRRRSCSTRAATSASRAWPRRARRCSRSITPSTSPARGARPARAACCRGTSTPPCCSRDATEIERAVAKCLADGGGPGRHILNLGTASPRTRPRRTCGRSWRPRARRAAGAAWPDRENGGRVQRNGLGLYTAPSRGARRAGLSPGRARGRPAARELAMRRFIERPADRGARGCAAARARRRACVPRATSAARRRRAAGGRSRSRARRRRGPRPRRRARRFWSSSSAPSSSSPPSSGVRGRELVAASASKRARERSEAGGPRREISESSTPPLPKKQRAAMPRS